MRRYLLPFCILASVVLFVAAACGGDSGPDAPDATPTPDARIVTSDDGKLTLAIPLGAVSDDQEITITTVPLAELPDPLPNVRGAGTGYKLEPDGLEFSEPVLVTLELDRNELEPEEEGAVTAYALITQSTGGGLEVLPEHLLQWTLGEEAVTISAQLTHFSWITRTKGSLTVSLEKLPREHPLGSTFTAEGRVGNGDSTGQAMLEGVRAEFLAFGAVSTSGETNIDIDLEQLVPPGAAFGRTKSYECGDTPGLGAYSLRGEATSIVETEEGPIRTDLSVIVDGVIDCVAEGAPPPSPEPTSTPVSSAPTSPPTATPPASSSASMQISCEHTDPGVSSELIVRISGLEPGQDVDGEVFGGGLEGGADSFEGAAGGDGTAEFRLTITDFGEYDVSVASPALSETYTVTGDCPG